MPQTSALDHLARMYGIQTAYYDVDDRLCTSRPESLVRILQLLDVPITTPADAPQALRERRVALWQQILEPVAVAWEGTLTLRLQLPPAHAESSFHCRIVLEDGSSQSFDGHVKDWPLKQERSVEGVSYAVRQLTLPQALPLGYHRLFLELGTHTVESFIISAPRTAYSPKTETAHRRWGVFLPLYALHTEASWGGGDFSDLQAMMTWVSNRGGGLVATLPLLAWLSEVSDDPSPYSPASRLFWNEFYLDVTRIPELQKCPGAQVILAAAESRQTLDELRSDAYVDYKRQMQLKRRVLEQLAEFYFRQDVHDRAELETFRLDHPELETFARFRAVGERQGQAWPLWPESLRRGTIQNDDYDQHIFEYHLYTQWQVERQLKSLAEQAQATDMLWYLDFPLGVAGAGYDVWKEQDVFALGATAGAPPDAFFTRGQNWGFPPLHPHQLRRQEYRYVIQSLRRHLKFARLLRIDHVMSLHRMYWIPEDFDAKDGVYVHHRTDEMFALLTLESHRHQAEIVGENLGTVPAAVNNALDEHHIRKMFVAQFEIQPDQEPPLHAATSSTVASLNTHDMPSFAAFWGALDVDDRLELQLIDENEAQAERDRRAKLRLSLAAFLRQQGLLDNESLDPQDVLNAWQSWLAAGPADVLLVNLEDLWQETLPQNTPGTFRERRNWQRKLRYRFEEFCDLPQVVDSLALIDRQRAEQGSPE